MFLRALRLRNYRSFLDTGVIELRPIVVLVGANSSGKSSLLRFFPLLRQTFATPRRSPLLWYGDDVDFGDFQSVLCRAATEPRIVVELETRIGVTLDDGREHFKSHTDIMAAGERTFVDTLAVRLGNDRETIRFRPDGQVRTIDRGDGTSWNFPSAQEGLPHEVEGSNELIPFLMPSSPWFPGLPALLQQLNHELRQFSRNIAYIGPFREGPQRDYRKQEVAVDRIARHGGNLAMFLYVLPESSRQAFADWAAEYFGFRVRVAAEGNRVMLRVEQDGRAFHLIDVGYGFSQVLPIIAQCWAAAHGESNSEREPAPELVAIEQPELHLHPRHQQTLADMFAGMVRSQLAPHLVIETHSEVMINRFGELVEAGKLDREAVSVLLIEKDPKSGVSTVTHSEFDEQGVLTNWPIGFFAP